jgi:REP element-mobilizing transposase RayT
MPEPIAYFLTWATYGTWLPGDERGWVEYHRGWQMPDPVRKLEAAARMTEDACWLTPEQRAAVHEQVAETCRYRGWTLHAVNCRTNHVHVVISAPISPQVVRSQLKAWCTRKLKRLAESGSQPGRARANWWAERGSLRYINDEASLEDAIVYVRDYQDTNPKRERGDAGSKRAEA